MECNCICKQHCPRFYGCKPCKNCDKDGRSDWRWECYKEVQKKLEDERAMIMYFCREQSTIDSDQLDWIDELEKE